MGYQINSPWTNLRSKDIKRLNEIIDNDYCIEQEIGRKLNIMTTFERKFNEAIDNFNFESVIAFMKAVNWEWAFYKNSKSYYAIPTKKDIISALKEIFKDGLYHIIELNKTRYETSTGGLVFNMVITEEYPSNSNCFIDIYFDIAHFRKDD